MEHIYDSLIDFFNEENETDTELDNIMQILIESKIIGDKNKSRQFLHIISSISLNTYDFLKNQEKIQKLIIRFQKDSKDLILNKELFDIFMYNRRLLLLLIEESIIQFDSSMAYQMMHSQDISYILYFYLELKPYMNSEIELLIKKHLPKLGSMENFPQKRKLGQNDQEICEIIRSDMVDEFGSYISQTNSSLNSTIQSSIYETNRLLVVREPSLIQYAAFYGSIHIFKYLYLHNVKLIPEIWPYAIHGRNYEIIHILETIQVEIPLDIYNNIFIEIIRSHHNELFEYIVSNSSDILQKIDSKTLLAVAYESHNYKLIPDCLFECPKSVFQSFSNACQFDYFDIADFLLRNQGLSIFALSYTNILIS